MTGLLRIDIMVKKIDLQTIIHGCTAQQFFDVVYGSGDPMAKFHLIVNKVTKFEKLGNVFVSTA
jgi:hypothetical protein